MDRDRGKGILNKVIGALKKRMGRLTGDRKIQADGHYDTAKGEAQNTLGGVKDSLRDKP